MPRYPVAILLLSILLLSGCANPNEVVSSRLKQALQEKVGKAESYDVEVLCKPQYRLLRGEVDRLTVDGKKVNIGGDLTALKVRVSIADIKYNIRGNRLDSVGKTVVSIDIHEKDLTSFARRERPEISGLTVDISDNLITVNTARGEQRQTIAGRLSAEGKNKLVLIPVRTTGSDSLNKATLDSLNPIIDLSKFAFPMTINLIELKDDTLRIRAAATPPPSLFKK